MLLQLSEQQLKAIWSLDNGKILKGGVGSGKTRTALAYWFFRECLGDVSYNELKYQYQIKKPLDLIVITTPKKRDERDWVFELLPFKLYGLTAGTKSKQVIKQDIKLCEGQPMTIIVDSWHNINKYVNIKDAFFIFDEQRVTGKGAWVKGFFKITSQNRWILLSATPGDDFEQYFPVFKANGFYRTKTEFDYRHVVLNPRTPYRKILRYLEVDHLMYLRDKITVPLQSTVTNTRHFHTLKHKYNKQDYEKLTVDRWNIYEDKPIRNAAELAYCIRRVSSADSTKLDLLKDIYDRHDKLIVFYNYNYELELLEEYCHNNRIPYSQWNGHKHEDILPTDRWFYLVQYTSGAEGWNCIITDATVFFSLNYSYKIMEQSCGRIDRMNTTFKDLHYYKLCSDSPVDKKIQQAIEKKKSFNLARYAGDLFPEPEKPTTYKFGEK